MQLLKRKPRWGALKIRECLQAELGEQPLPAVSTIELILKRHGLAKKRRAVRRIRETLPIFEANKPNEIWSTDFKGEFSSVPFHSKCGTFVHRILDFTNAFSRYLLA